MERGEDYEPDEVEEMPQRAGLNLHRMLMATRERLERETVILEPNESLGLNSNNLKKDPAMRSKEQQERSILDKREALQVESKSPPGRKFSYSEIGKRMHKRTPYPEPVEAIL